MALMNQLAQRHASIVDHWYDIVLESYAPETSRLLKKETNRFANPVGITIREGLRELFGELLKGFDPQQLSATLDKIIRIRAIQEFSPGQALAFVLAFKQLVRRELAQPIRDNLVAAEELLQFDEVIDRLALLAFNVYMQCREQLYELRINEVRNSTARLLQRANILWSPPEQEVNSQESTNTNPT
jgi:hypothetical protein